MISALPPQSRTCHKTAALIRRAAIFLMLMISLLAGISALTADVTYTTTSSSKGWSRTTGVNKLGLATTNTLSGTGIPTTSLKAVATSRAAFPWHRELRAGVEWKSWRRILKHPIPLSSGLQSER